MKKIMAATAVLVAVPLVALAQSGSRPSTPTSSQGVGQQGMSLQAFQARHEHKLMAADTDGDGRVSRAELMAAASTGRGYPAKRFARFDRNGDGYIDKAEVDAMLAHRFKRMDANGDGVVTPQERMAAKAARHDAGQVADAS